MIVIKKKEKNWHEPKRQSQAKIVKFQHSGPVKYIKLARILYILIPCPYPSIYFCRDGKGQRRLR